MILLVDHEDSFTRNLEHLLAGFDEVAVLDRRAVKHEDCERAEMIVFSPGPGNPSHYPETASLYREWVGRKPLLGICLGFQLILECEGARIVRQSQVLHGVETDISVRPDSRTYRDLPNPLRVGRYHSLQVDPASLAGLPDSLVFTGEDPLRKAPLSFEDLDRLVFGLQYHPESFLTSEGRSLIENVRHACLE